MKLLLTIEIHVAVCELQATHRPTITGLLLHNCVIQVSLLRGVWNSGAAPAGVHRGAAIGFGKQYSKQRTIIVNIRASCLKKNQLLLNDAVVMYVAARRALFDLTPYVDTGRCFGAQNGRPKIRSMK